MSFGRRSLLKLAGAALLVLKGGRLPEARPPLPRGDPTTAAPAFTIATTDPYAEETAEMLAAYGEFDPYSTVKVEWPPPEGAPRLRWRNGGWEEVLPPDTLAELMRLHAKDEAPR